MTGEARDGLVVFEDTGWGREQDRLRAEGFRVVGGSEFGDRLEDDRVLGQSVLRDAGLHVAPTVELDGFDEALACVARHPARYVLKFSGGATDSTRSYVGGLDDGRDVAAVLQLQRRRAAGARSRQDDARDRADVASLARASGLDVVLDGVRPFRLWNGAAYRLRKSAGHARATSSSSR